MEAPAKQADAESDTEDEDEEKPQAAPEKKKCEPQICKPPLICH